LTAPAGPGEPEPDRPGPESDCDAPVESQPEDQRVPGLAGERTDLAWSRSGLAIAAVAAAVVRLVFEQLDNVTGRVAVIGIMTGAAASWAMAMWLAPLARGPLQGRPVADQRALRRASAGTVALAAAALLLSVIPT
jgi:uncharacterized membrane protein YidH (DUF202 family)